MNEGHKKDNYNRKDRTTVWECTCKCGFSWTDNENNTSCPECGSDEGTCVEHKIPECDTCKDVGTITKWQECGDCGGSGKAWAECPTCQGEEGVVAECPTCHGEGVVPGDDPCGLCNGEKGTWVTEDCPDCQ